MTPSPPPVLCLGEALVDLVGRRSGERLPELGPFSAHLGGVAANVAVIAARAGARVALAGGAGDDAWGRWLRDRLAAEGVELSLFSLTSGRPTALAFVAIDAAGEPTYTLHGESTDAVMAALSDRIEVAAANALGLLVSTNTLVRTVEREITMRARAAAVTAGRPVIFDANLRLGRWPTAQDAVRCARSLLPGARLVRANADEARLLTGEIDPERAAAALLEAGAELVVLTRGAHGALLRGAATADASGVAVPAVVNTAGAGDAVTGTLLARLAGAEFAPHALVAALPEAMAAAAAACGRAGAVD